VSPVLIHQYPAHVDVLKRVGGTYRESVVREAFEDPFKGWGRQHDLVFIPECKLNSAAKDTSFANGKLPTVDIDRAVVRDDKRNRPCRPAMVRTLTEYNVAMREYRAARLTEFVAHEARFDAREFTRFTQRCAKAWKDVPDASAWVVSPARG
jgi:hypothetical protein